MQVTIYRLDKLVPRIPASAFVAAEAVLIGDVRLGERVSIWPGVVIRADNDSIVVGDDSNVQDGAVLHADPGFPLWIGDGVTVGHQAMLHGCTIGDGSLIGIQALVMNDAVIGRESLLGAGALVTEGKSFPERSLLLGAPARVKRQLTEAEIDSLRDAANSYVQRAALYRRSLEAIE